MYGCLVGEFCCVGRSRTLGGLYSRGGPRLERRGGKEGGLLSSEGERAATQGSSSRSIGCFRSCRIVRLGDEMLSAA